MVMFTQLGYYNESKDSRVLTVKNQILQISHKICSLCYTLQLNFTYFLNLFIEKGKKEAEIGVSRDCTSVAYIQLRKYMLNPPVCQQLV